MTTQQQQSMPCRSVTSAVGWVVTNGHCGYHQHQPCMCAWVRACVCMRVRALTVFRRSCSATLILGAPSPRPQRATAGRSAAPSYGIPVALLLCVRVCVCVVPLRRGSSRLLRLRLTPPNIQPANKHTRRRAGADVIHTGAYVTSSAARREPELPCAAGAELLLCVAPCTTDLP